jgi:hypothetical protein
MGQNNVTVNIPIDWVLEPVNNFCKAGHQEYTQMKFFDSWQGLKLANCRNAENEHSLTTLPNTLSAGHPDWEFIFQSGIILFM